MSGPAQPAVRVIGPPLPYRDDAEASVLAAIEAAADRSSGSDELEAAIDGWAARYHLSAARGNLLRPFALGTEHRILEVGAGCGAITRYLGETGAQVVALEGSPDRAKAAAARCRGLDNVEIVTGPLSAFEDAAGFDLVVVVGVLEYAGAAAGGGRGAKTFLESVRKHLRAAGALILSIENQLGLRYLLGGTEEHLGRPWVGVAGYPNAGGVRTWSRAPLRALLAEHGFAKQRWLFPFPDYKLPQVMVAEDAYEQSSPVDLIDQLVGAPTPSDEREHIPVTDERQAHRVMVEAGVGPEIANAFLVCCAAEDGVIENLVDRRSVAWYVSHQRRAPWRRIKTVQQTEAGRLSVVSRPIGTARSQVDDVDWLRHVPGTAVEPYVRGRTLEQEILDACLVPDPERIGAVLKRWLAHLAAHELDHPEPADPHPLRPPNARAILPAQMVDLDLGNFVIDAEDRIHYIDDEWHARGGVDADLARLRALWHLAVDLVRWRGNHPWPAAGTPRGLVKALGAACGMTIDDDAVRRLRRAESELVAAVTGRPATVFLERFDEVGAWRGPRSAIEVQLDEVLAGQERSAGIYEAEIARRGAEIAALRDSNATLRSALASATDARDGLRQRADTMNSELHAIHGSRMWRLWQTYHRLLRRLGRSR